MGRLELPREYQACDEKICFNPESVPVSWTFTLRRLVVERPSVTETKAGKLALAMDHMAGTLE